MLLRKTIAAGAIVFSVLNVSTALAALDAGFCDEYAKKAVEAEKVNQEKHCGYKGAAWSDKGEGHKKWCMMQKSKEGPEKQTKDREEEVKKCMAKK